MTRRSRWRRADELERCGVRFLDMLACQIRANYYAYQGDEELAQEHERRVELHATRTGTTCKQKCGLRAVGSSRTGAPTICSVSSGARGARPALSRDPLAREVCTRGSRHPRALARGIRRRDPAPRDTPHRGGAKGLHRLDRARRRAGRGVQRDGDARMRAGGALRESRRGFHRGATASSSRSPSTSNFSSR